MLILVADDEKLVRYTLKSMLEEIKIPARSIQLARDGEEMIEKIGSTQPDLAFVDIKMPKLNGLEAMKRARALSPHTKWIILTSYSSFEYAKQAIGLGAEDYLLKPVSPEELAQAIRKIAIKNRQDCLRSNEEFEAHLNALFHNTLAMDHDSVEFISSAIFSGALLVFDSSLGEKDLLDQQRCACNLVRKKLSSAISETTRVALCTLPEGQPVLVGAFKPGIRAGDAGQTIRCLFRKVQSAVRAAVPESVCLSQLLSDDCRSYQEFFNQLYLLNELAPLRVVLGVGGQIPLQSLREREKCTPQLRFCRSLISLSEAFREKSQLDFLKLTDEAEKTWKAWNPADQEVTCKRIVRFLEASLDFRSSEGLRTDTWLRELKNQAGRFLKSTEAGHYGDPIDQVVQFVQGNFMHNIGIAQIASNLGITPNYLSYLFRKHTGITFIKYITRLRMSKAQKVLADPSSQVQQVARQVGYFSTRHFSKLFKQHFGYHPSEFQRSQRQRPVES